MGWDDSPSTPTHAKGSKVIRKQFNIPLPTGEALSIRAVADWYKEIVQAEKSLTITAEERDYTNHQYSDMVRTLAIKEGIPVGFLGYMIQELVAWEISLIKTAEAEAAAAGVEV